MEAVQCLLLNPRAMQMHVFINQKLQVSASGSGSSTPFKLTSPISLKPGMNEIALLSMTVGLQNACSFYEWIGAGPYSVRIMGMKNGTVDLSSSAWTYKIKMKSKWRKMNKLNFWDGRIQSPKEF